ncbi:MAG: hypothetical protein M1832_005700 [Thelocarpon impressellum]|nr:MAG: hypothetical protein M1832_005700 [Thelocarpon impressellum]
MGGVGLSALSGMGLGLSLGAQTAGLRFRAENAHRLPRTATGWFLYHKSKNYHIMFGGIREGLRMGGKLGLLVGGFSTVEEAVDRLRGMRDFLSTVVAGLSIAGGFSLWNRFPAPTAARTARTGLVFGLVFGLAQDALSTAQGRRLGYGEFVLGRQSRTVTRMSPDDDGRSDSDRPEQRRAVATTPNGIMVTSREVEDEPHDDGVPTVENEARYDAELGGDGGSG